MSGLAAKLRPAPLALVRGSGCPRSLRAGVGLILALASVLGCPTAPSSAARGDARVGQADARDEPAPRELGSAPEFVLAPATGEVVELVAAEQRRAAADGKTLLVYVGASWCEPCQYFHGAVDEGRFDDDLADVRLLEFDLDRDRDRLIAAGYRSRMIPLFVAPGPAGEPGPRRTEGGVKGPDAVDNLRERLVPLVRAARADRASLERG